MSDLFSNELRPQKHASLLGFHVNSHVTCLLKAVQRSEPDLKGSIDGWTLKTVVFSEECLQLIFFLKFMQSSNIFRVLFLGGFMLPVTVTSI